jgi:hypothetical protein
MEDSKKEVQCGQDRTSCGPDNCAIPFQSNETTNTEFLASLTFMLWNCTCFIQFYQFMKETKLQQILLI